MTAMKTSKTKMASMAFAPRADYIMVERFVFPKTDNSPVTIDTVIAFAAERDHARRFSVGCADEMALPQRTQNSSWTSQDTPRSARTDGRPA